MAFDLTRKLIGSIDGPKTGHLMDIPKIPWFRPGQGQGLVEDQGGGSGQGCHQGLDQAEVVGRTRGAGMGLKIPKLGIVPNSGVDSPPDSRPPPGDQGWVIIMGGIRNWGIDSQDASWLRECGSWT